MALMKRLEALERDNIKMREQLTLLLSNSTSNSYPSQNNLQIQQQQQDQQHEQQLSEEMLDVSNVSDVLWQSPSELSLFPDTTLFSCHDELSSQYLSIPENQNQSCSSSSHDDYLTTPQEDIPLDDCLPSPILSLSSSSPSSTSTSTESPSSLFGPLSSILPSTTTVPPSLPQSCNHSLHSISSLPMCSPETMSLAFRILLDSFGTSAARTAIMMNYYYYYYYSTSSQQRNTVLPMYYHPTLTFQTILPIQSSQTSAPISLLVIVHQYLMNFVRILSILGGVTRMDWLPLESKSIDINKKDMEWKRNFLVESESKANVNIENLMNNYHPDHDVDGVNSYDDKSSMLLLLESERIRSNNQFKWEENWRNEIWRRLVFGDNINSVNMLHDRQKNEISEILLS